MTRFLDSPRWGEHRARYWLDSARYADTNGYHFDNFREAWAFRDWVIGAFNRNLPFDRFTIEQLAGDLFPGSTLDQQVASGFNRCNMTTNEGGSIPEEYQVLYTRDRTETVSQVWLGLTAGCAVCHDHKFDPISQREFYELSAFFNNTTQPIMDGNVKDTPPTIFVPSAADRPRWQGSAGRTGRRPRSSSKLRKQSARADFTKWLAAANPKALEAMIPTSGLQLAAIDPPRSAMTPSPARVSESADVGRLRERPCVLVRGLDQGSQAGPDRLGDRPDGRPQQLPGLGYLARRRADRRLIWSTSGPTMPSRSSRGARLRQAPGLTCSSPTTARPRPPE